MAKKKSETVTAPAAEGEVVTAGTTTAADVAAKSEAAAAPKDTRNGVTRPKPDSQTGKVWVIADQLAAAAGAPPERKAVLEACKAAGINDATAQTQHGRWKKYYGLVTARVPAPPAEAAAVVPAAPPAPTTP